MMASSGERKTITVLFADIKGSTEIMRDLDPALKLMIDAVHYYDGYFVQSTGDGILALFGAPVAKEDQGPLRLSTIIRQTQHRIDSRSAGRTTEHYRVNLACH
jgi:class 3 adenylate cyclase